LQTFYLDGGVSIGVLRLRLVSRRELFD